jgi:AP-4 complex subunit epsilon-1
MVVDCLEDADDTLKIKTLELLFKMTNNMNVEPIVDKLLSFLKDAPVESSSRKDLVVKLNELAEKFSPNKNWYIKTMNKLFEMGGDLITQDLTNKFIQSVGEYEKHEDGDVFRENTIKIYLKVLKKNPNIPESLMMVIAWIMGEYGPDIPDKEKLESIVDELCHQAYIGYEDPNTIALIVSALGKIHHRSGYAPNP